MHVNDAVARNIDDGLRNDLTVADHHHGVRLHLFQLLHWLGPANALRLMHRERKSQRRFFHGGRGQFPAPAFRTIWLREHGQHRMSGLDDSFQRGNGEGGGAEEDERHVKRRRHECRRCTQECVRHDKLSGIRQDVSPIPQLSPACAPCDESDRA